MLQHASLETADAERRLRASLVGGDRSGYRIDVREVRRFVAEGVPDAVRSAEAIGNDA